MKKLHTILLIDDDEATNFIHKFVIQKENCAEHVVAVQSGQEALDFLQKKVAGKYPQPEIIFLDINMPGMNGWEFLEHYEKINANQKGKKVVVMLTTSLDPFDREKAKTINKISEFMSKPLTSLMIKKILKENFPELDNED